MPDAPTTVAAPPAAPVPELTHAPASAASPASAHESFPRIKQTPIPDKIMDAFRKRARPPGTEMSNKPVGSEPREEPAKATPPKTEPAKALTEAEVNGEAETDETNTDETETKSGSDETKTGTDATKPGSDETKPGGKRTSPWRLVEQYKSKVAGLEKELAEVRSGSTNGKPGEAPPEVTERLTKAESRVKELEEEIRFTNYQKSDEFKTKYQQPYEAAWARAVKDLSEVTVTDAQGNTRAASPEDMLTLVNLPLGKARELADAMFGPFANDAMGHRKAIKDLFDAQQQGIADARKNAETWEKTREETVSRVRADIDKAVGEIWTKANQDAATDTKYGQYFTPRENDPEWNQRLAKGYELVDKAFSDANPRDHRLTPEQRKSVIERHAAVRNRAAAFGPLRHENERLTARVAELEKELSQYRESEAPQSGGAKAAPKGQTTPADPWDRVREGIRKYAR